MLEDRFRSRIPAAIRRNVLAPMGEWYPKLGWAPRMFRAKSTLQSLARDLLEAYFHLISGCPPTLKSQLLSGDVSNRLAGYDSCDVLRSWWDRADTTDPLSRIQYVDMKTYLADDILVKVDRASMANSLEVRSPLLDHKLMELVARIPSSLKLNHASGQAHIQRVVVRSSSFGDPVPKETGLCRSGGGMVSRGVEGLRRRSFVPQWRRPVERLFIERCWRQHQAGERDWSSLLWSVLMFRTWQEVSRPV